MRLTLLIRAGWWKCEVLSIRYVSIFWVKFTAKIQEKVKGSCSCFGGGGPYWALLQVRKRAAPAPSREEPQGRVSPSSLSSV